MHFIWTPKTTFCWAFLSQNAVDMERSTTYRVVTIRPIFKYSFGNTIVAALSSASCYILLVLSHITFSMGNELCLFCFARRIKVSAEFANKLYRIFLWILFKNLYEFEYAIHNHFRSKNLENSRNFIEMKGEKFQTGPTITTHNPNILFWCMNYSLYFMVLRQFMKWKLISVYRWCH